MTIEKLIISIAVIALITFSTRAIPFLIFGHGKEPASVILYLGKYLPPAIITIILIYCFKDISFISGNFGLPEIIGSGIVVFLQLKFKNTMISIFTATVIYMILVQFIFI